MSVIAADGIHSEIVRFLYCVSVVAGGNCLRSVWTYRGLGVRMSVFPHWPADRWQRWLGKGRTFLCLSDARRMKDGINICRVRVPDGPEDEVRGGGIAGRAAPDLMSLSSFGQISVSRGWDQRVN